MTNNNLELHLNWLLCSKSFIPCAIPPLCPAVSRSTQPITSDDRIDVQRSNPDEESDDWDISQAAESLLPAVPDMARLHAAPKSANRQRLLVQLPQEPAQSPSRQVGYTHQPVSTPEQCVVYESVQHGTSSYHERLFVRLSTNRP